MMPDAAPPVDKVLLEILANRFTGIVEEMGYVIHRAAFTTFVKETWDFDSALITPTGEVFAYPRNIGVTNMLSIDMLPAIRCFEGYEPGDVVLTNSPLHAKGMATHLPDLMMFRPIFADGRLICFAWCSVHSTDVGGIVPGSITPRATDRFQEGIAIPPVKLYKAGKLDEEMKRFLLANTRIPEQNWGDIGALTAALVTAGRRMTECLERYGADRIEQVMAGLLDYGEARARRVIEKVPDGTYDFADYIEGDMMGTHHVRIRLSLEVRGSAVTMDFTGTDPEVRAAYNLPTHGGLNQFLVLGLVNFLRTSDPEMPFNRGVLRPISVTVPEGSLINPSPAAATGVRYTTALRISDVVMGALSQAAPAVIPAAGSGQYGLLTLSDRNPRDGTYHVHVLQPLQGGSGGRPGKDGIDGVNFSGGALRNAPVEALEAENPILVLRYALNDAVAPGRWRGGSGILFECQTTSPHALLTSRGWDRFTLCPWGRDGGAGGTLGDTLLFDTSGAPRRIPKIESLRLAPGEQVRVVAPGGGGHGDPLLRDPDAVLRDVEDGFVTVQAARASYGIIIEGGAVSGEATADLRRALAGRPPPTFFTFGAARLAYEAAVTPAFQDLLQAVLQEEPGSTRLHLRDAVIARCLAEGSCPGADGIRAFVATLAAPDAERRFEARRWSFGVRGDGTVSNDV